MEERRRRRSGRNRKKHTHRSIQSIKVLLISIFMFPYTQHSYSTKIRLCCYRFLWLPLSLSLQSTFNSHIMTQHEYHMLNVNIVIYPLSIAFLSYVRVFFWYCFVSPISWLRIAFMWLTQSATTMKMMKMCNNLTFNLWKTEIDSHKRYNEIHRNMCMCMSLHVYRIRTKLSYSHSSISFERNGNVQRSWMPGWWMHRRSSTDNTNVATATIVQDSFGALMPMEKILTMKLIKIICTHTHTCIHTYCTCTRTRKKFIKPMQDENGKRYEEKSLSLNIVSIALHCAALRYALSPLLILF